jgi:hypothetical protein
MIDKPGIYQMTHDEYHSDPALTPSLSRNIIKLLITETPAHARHAHPRLNPNFEEDDGGGKFDMGTAAHALLLEGEANTVIVEADSWRTKAAQEARNDARKEGKAALLTEQFERVKLVSAAAEKQILGCTELGIKDFYADGKTEQSYFWEEDGTWLRSRPDWISNDHKLILDVKFTDRSANPASIDKHIVSMGYQIQDAFYSRGAKDIHGVDPKFVFVFIELAEPFLCSFVGLSNSFKDMGRQQIEFGIFTWRECLKNNSWPGYPQRVAWVDAPPWALAYWEEIGAEMGVGK